MDVFSRNTLFNVLAVFLSGPSSTASASIITVTLDLFASTLLCVTIPRFIISIRELYDRDLRGRWEGIDNGFGVISQPNANEIAVMSGIAFADTPQEEGQAVDPEGTHKDDSGAVQPDVLDVIEEPRGAHLA